MRHLCCLKIVHQKLNGTESQRTPKEGYDRAIKYPGFFEVRSVGPVGDFLEIEMLQFVFSFAPLEGREKNPRSFGSEGFHFMD